MKNNELIYGSFFSYNSKPKSDSERIAKEKVREIKFDKMIEGKLWSQEISLLMKRDFEKLPFNNFFGKGTYLVPAPKSSLMVQDSLWVPSRIALAMSQKGFGIYFPCLERQKSVNKAAFSKYEDRPKIIEHLDSLKINSMLITEKMERIVIIDDVTTTGATLLGCALKLKEKFIEIPIFGFAVIRTVDDFKNFEEPFIGKINEINNGRTHRES